MKAYATEEALQDYCAEMTSPASALLNEVERATHLHTTQPIMLSGHLQGRFLSMIAKCQRPKRILEIGTFTGYASLCLAEGLPEDGKLVSTEVNEELEPMILKFWDQSPFRNQMELHIGDALDYIQTEETIWDLIFIDAKKADYPKYFEALQSKTHEGSLILADNVLWKAKVLEEQKDKKTQILHDFNQLITDHPNWENVLVPIRDGVMMARKKG